MVSLRDYPRHIRTVTVLLRYAMRSRQSTGRPPVRKGRISTTTARAGEPRAIGPAPVIVLGEVQLVLFRRICGWSWAKAQRHANRLDGSVPDLTSDTFGDMSTWLDSAAGMRTSPLTSGELVNAAYSTLRDFSRIATRLDRDRIEKSVTLTWPNPPSPLIYWLFVASDDNFMGAASARNLLASLELMLKLLEFSSQIFSGSWKSRIGKLIPPKNKAVGKDHVTEFRAALFELLLAFRLLANDTVIEFQSDTTIACDIVVSFLGTKVLSVEAYAPQKTVDIWYENGVAAPWRKLIGADRDRERDEPQREPEVPDIFVDSEAVPRALSNVLTDSNFKRQKARQLSSGSLPTLLAIRVYELIPRLHDLFAVRSADELAGAVPAEAWSKLPEGCIGLLLCFISDVLGESNYVMFLPAPGRVISAEVAAYLSSAAIRSEHPQ